MNRNHEVTVEELLWVRETLSIFLRMEKSLKKGLGNYGKEKLVLKNPAYFSGVAVSLLAAAAGIYFYLIQGNIYFLVAVCIPVGAFLIIQEIVQKETKKNIFRFFRKYKCINEESCFTVQKHILNNKESFEDLLAWNAERSGMRKNGKYMQILNKESWENIEKSSQQFVWLAILMIELQKFLAENKEFYNEHVRNVPSSKTTYRPKKKTRDSILDNNTFQSGFTEDMTEKY